MTDDSFSKLQDTIFKMLTKRNYTRIELDDTGDVPMYHANTSNLKDEDTVCVFLRIIPKLNASEIQAHIAIMEEQKLNHIILIYSGVPTPVVKTTISHFSNLGKHIEIFNVTDLQYDITEHVLACKHEKSRKEDLGTIKKKHLPDLKSDDPMARFYGFRSGDIIKITRKDGSIAFRVVK